MVQGFGVSLYHVVLDELSEELIAVSKDGLSGYIDINGNLIVDYQFNTARPFSEGLAAVEIDGKWAYIANPLVYSSWVSDELGRASYTKAHWCFSR